MIKVKYHSVKESEEYNLVDLPFTQWKFPVGEIGVKFDSLPDYSIDSVAVYWKFESNEELFVIANLIDAVQQHNLSVGYGPAMSVLVVPYLPYSRQDRVCHPGESFALEVFARLLEDIVDEIITYDVHNWDVASKVFSNLTNVTQAGTAREMTGYDFFIAPDAGAAKKIFSHPEVQSGRTKVITLEKTRVDGKVIYSPYTGEKLYGRIAVVDDLCDGGATFIEVAKNIHDFELSLEYDTFDLFVTHGWFTKGVGAGAGEETSANKLSFWYDNIYCFKLYNESVRDEVKEFMNEN